MSINESEFDYEEYKGIRDQDGWETLELTVRAEHSPEIADETLEALMEVEQ